LRHGDGESIRGDRSRERRECPDNIRVRCPKVLREEGEQRSSLLLRSRRRLKKREKTGKTRKRKGNLEGQSDQGMWGTTALSTNQGKRSP